eukprot:307657-Chlamydomonas_euryale.AAC.1
MADEVGWKAGGDQMVEELGGRARDGRTLPASWLAGGECQASGEVCVRARGEEGAQGRLVGEHEQGRRKGRERSAEGARA